MVVRRRVSPRGRTRQATPARAALLACLFTALGARALAEPAVAPVPDPIWDGRLWLTSQALGLPEDCTVRALFQDPRFRSTPLDGGGAVTSRLVSASTRLGDLFLTVETTRGGSLLERVVLQLRAHPSAGMVSVETISLRGAGDEPARTLSYEDAVEDDEEYDVFTDTLVSLYQAFFDGTEVAARRSGLGR